MVNLPCPGTGLVIAMRLRRSIHFCATGKTKNLITKSTGMSEDYPVAVHEIRSPFFNLIIGNVEKNLNFQ